MLGEEPGRGFESLRILQYQTQACRSGRTALPRKQMVPRGARRFESFRFHDPHASVAQLDESAGLRNRRSQVRILPEAPAMSSCSPSGETGRRASSRGSCRKARRFESCDGHHHHQHLIDTGVYESQAQSTCSGSRRPRVRISPRRPSPARARSSAERARPSYGRGRAGSGPAGHRASRCPPSSRG
jgi:hypothetical protein